MKKLTVVFGLVFLFVMLAFSIVSAAPADVSDEIKDFVAFDGDGDSVYPVSAKVHKIVTYSNGENITLSISGILPNWEGVVLPDKALHLETGHLGYICTYEAPNFKYTLSPSGNFSYTCWSE